jgi:hypothetical protein
MSSNKYPRRTPPKHPTTRSGRSKQSWRLRKHGDYEATLWSYVEMYQSLPVEVVKVPPAELDKRKTYLDLPVRYFVRAHYTLVIRALNDAVVRDRNQLRSDMGLSGIRDDLAPLLTRPQDLGLKGSTKLPVVRLMEKIQRAPKAWWLGLDAHREHMDILHKAGENVLVEWLRQYRPSASTGS